MFSVSAKNTDAAVSAMDAGTKNESSCPSLSLKQRMIGFLITIAIGGLLGAISVFLFFQNQVPAFAVLYTLSNVFAIASTSFWVGPQKQIKKMVKPHRLIATIIFVVSMVLTLVFAFAVPTVSFLIVVFVIIQFVAFLWYTLSFMPLARRITKKICTKICPCIKQGPEKA
eukprot:TRINITY_DN4836_c0_g1_i1.p1 TRINITY_DN4836_c0_g1~~TRINITY_DN4836_c0_g1_i1.p1  ORF type:complete len:170 (-),score=18.77 TRINITY_DN4836_c0_g1_i1:209-718(-)